MCHKSSDSPTFRNEGQDYHCKTVNVGGGKVLLLLCFSYWLYFGIQLFSHQVSGVLLPRDSCICLSNTVNLASHLA